MSYVDFCLTFPSKAKYQELVPEELNGFTIDVIGEVYVGGSYDENGDVLQAPQKVDGYHVNMRAHEGMALPESLLPYLINVPQDWRRKWA